MPILEAAKHYASLDISVVPTTNKVPPIKWEKYKNEIMSAKEIEKHFAYSSQVAMVCGKVSQSMEVIDIDSKHDPTGRLYDDYCRLINQADPSILKTVLIQKTISGGYHFVYRCPIIAGNKKLAKREDGESLIETRGEAGYFLVWPSVGYELLQGSFDKVPAISIPQREILWDSARALNRHHPKVYEPKVKPADDTPAPVGLSAGDDYDSRGEEVIILLLEKHGWTVVAQSEGKHGTVTKFKRPGESDSAYSAHFNFIPNRFYCWSTSTVFEAQTVYKPYAVFALLECDGDFKRAANDLYELGYGERTEQEKAIKPKISTKNMNQTQEAPQPAAEQDEDCDYMRVGITYFKRISVTDLHGNTIQKIVKWSKDELVLDNGKKFLFSIPKYDTFLVRPSHLEYKSVIGNGYNLYRKISHEVIEGDYTNINKFLSHIFGSKLELVMDYITILWRYPTQILPVLCLVSKERQTGKTTFFKLLRAIFQTNAVILKNENFQTAFNSHYAGKLLIMIDENYVELEKKKEAERIKSMATQDTEFIQFKGKDSEEVDFFGKILMTANNKEFIKIDKEEIRYMVVEVPQFEKNDPLLFEKMIEEIPAFLFHLTERAIIHRREDRAWFRPELLESETLNEVVRNTRLPYETLIDDFIEESLETFAEPGDELRMTLDDILEELEGKYKFLDKIKIKRYLNSLGYKAEDTQRYTFFSLLAYRKYDPTIHSTLNYEQKRRGRTYVFVRSVSENETEKKRDAKIIKMPEPID